MDRGEPLTLGEEIRIPLDQLAVHRRSGQTAERLNLLFLTSRRLDHVHGDLLNLVDGHRTSPP